MPQRLVCDLARFTYCCNHSGTFVAELWCFFAISTGVVVYLDTFSQHRLLRTCIVLQVDRTDVALGATEIRLGLRLSSWGVPTLPVQAFAVAPVTVWDLSISDLYSNSSSNGIA